jgi:hypothetical protein
VGFAVALRGDWRTQRGLGAFSFAVSSGRLLQEPGFLTGPPEAMRLRSTLTIRHTGDRPVFDLWVVPLDCELVGPPALTSERLAPGQELMIEYTFAAARPTPTLDDELGWGRVIEEPVMEVTWLTRPSLHERRAGVRLGALGIPLQRYTRGRWRPVDRIVDVPGRGRLGTVLPIPSRSMWHWLIPTHVLRRVGAR